MSSRVLIADCDTFLLAEYEEGLQEHGYEVATASSGLECVQLLREFRPHVLVMEPALLWGRGDGVVNVMHEDPDITRVPVILLTDGCEPGILYNLTPFPIDDYLRKPLAPDSLAERIDRTLERIHEKLDRCDGEAIE